MKLDGTVTYGVLKGISLCGCVPVLSTGAHWLSWGSWIWCEHESCLFPGCFGGYHLVKRWGWRWRGCGQCLVWAGASPLLIHQSQLLVCGWGPHCWSRSSDHWVWAGSVSSKCGCVAHSHLFPLPQGFWAGAVAATAAKCGTASWQ